MNCFFLCAIINFVKLEADTVHQAMILVYRILPFHEGVEIYKSAQAAFSSDLLPHLCLVQGRHV